MSLRFGPSVRFQFHVKGSSSTSPNPISRSFSDNIVPRTAAYLCSTTPFTRPANDTLSRFQKGNCVVSLRRLSSFLSVPLSSRVSLISSYLLPHCKTGNERSIQPPALLEFPSRFNGSTQRRLLASLTSTSPGRDDDGSWDDDRVTDEDDASRGETTIEIRESDLEEQFVRGSGPGGQKINKSSVCVVR